MAALWSTSCWKTKWFKIVLRFRSSREQISTQCNVWRRMTIQPRIKLTIRMYFSSDLYSARTMSKLPSSPFSDSKLVWIKVKTTKMKTKIPLQVGFQQRVLSCWLPKDPKPTQNIPNIQSRKNKRSQNTMEFPVWQPIVPEFSFHEPPMTLIFKSQSTQQKKKEWQS